MKKRMLTCMTTPADGGEVHVSYLDEDGEKQICKEAVSVTDADASSGWGPGWYVVKKSGPATIHGRVTVTGDVRLILEDGCDLTINGGVGVDKGSSLTIYGQSPDETAMGRLTAKAATAGDAGIGGGQGGDGGAITISGSNTKITAIGYNGNDIGGAGSRGATITIDPEATVQGKDGGPVKIGASHRASAAWKWNDTQHWHPCEVKDCTDTSHQSQREGHDFNDGTVDESGNLVKACTANCGYSKTLIPQSISVTTQPTLSYQSGASLDLTGLKITATYSDNSTKEIAYAENNGMSFSIDNTAISHGSPLNKTDHNGQKITVTYYNQTADTNVLTVTAATGVTVSVSASPAAGGTVSGDGTYTENASVTVTASANSGYHFVKWTESGGEVSTSASYTFTVTADRTLVAVFEQDSVTPPDPGHTGGGGGGIYVPPTYPPTVERPGEGGGTPSVTPSSPRQGDTVTVTPKPDEGYEVGKVTVTDQNGRPVEVTQKPDGAYTFTQPGGKVTIEVTYQPIDRPWNNPFADVSEGDWYYEAVRFVQEQGLMDGYDDGQFKPGNDLSRAQLAQILFNKEGRPAATGAELRFDDADKISSYALEAMRWAVENGVLGGHDDGRLDPKGEATRAQAAQMLKNFVEHQEADT